MPIQVQGYEVDPTLAKCGRPFDFNRNEDGSTFRVWIRPFGHAYNARLAALQKNAGEQVCKRNPEIAREQQVIAMSELILDRRSPDGERLAAWEHCQLTAPFTAPDGTEYPAGADLPPTPEIKQAMLRGGLRGEDPATYSTSFFTDVILVANEQANFKADALEEERKNSSSGSTGSSATVAQPRPLT